MDGTSESLLLVYKKLWHGVLSYKIFINSGMHHFQYYKDHNALEAKINLFLTASWYKHKCPRNTIKFNAFDIGSGMAHFRKESNRMLMLKKFHKAKKKTTPIKNS